ncbi:hypothetical protein LP421_02530 (plasmid) [Rhizobium sp. RCAM05350]|nr:hypothetical protein LP421_02530 [Rhizobium sp. RCAM05350]
MKNAFPLKLFLQHAKGLINIVITNQYLHLKPFDLGESSRNLALWLKLASDRRPIFKKFPTDIWGYPRSALRLNLCFASAENQTKIASLRSREAIDAVLMLSFLGDNDATFYSRHTTERYRCCKPFSMPGAAKTTCPGAKRKTKPGS